MIGPRLAERYYLPACEARVEDARASYVETVTEKVQSFEEQLRARASNARAAGQRQMDSMFGTDDYGQALRNLLTGFGAVDVDGITGAAIGMELDKQRASFRAGLAEDIERDQARQKFEGAGAFCGCNVAEGFSNRVDLAAYTASFRVYRPRMIDQLEAGAFFEPCGAPPVVMP